MSGFVIWMHPIGSVRVRLSRLETQMSAVAAFADREFEAHRMHCAKRLYAYATDLATIIQARMRPVTGQMRYVASLSVEPGST